MFKPTFIETKKCRPLWVLSTGPIIKYINLFETNLAKNIRPGPKGLMGFILFEGLYFCLEGVLSPPPQARAWLYVPEHEAIEHTGGHYTTED